MLQLESCLDIENQFIKVVATKKTHKQRYHRATDENPTVTPKQINLKCIVKNAIR